MNLNNKVALITGGTRMGHSIAELLAKRGCNVVFSYHSSKKEALQGAAAVRRQGRKTLVLRGNLTKEKDVRKIVHQMVKKLGHLDILINMTSQYKKDGWPHLLNIHLESAYLTTQYAAPFLKKRGGRVIHFSDWVAASGRPRYKNFTAYYTAKMGLIGLVEAQALELAPNVLVNAIAPGPILPFKGITKQEEREVIQATPLKRWGGPAEIAKAVLFLCETDFVTGECLRVDGGRHLY